MLRLVKTKSVRHCPLCFGESVHLLHTGTFCLPEGHPLEATIRVVSCVQCGFCFNDTSCKRADYDKYYREVSKYTDPRLSSGSGAKKEDSNRLDETAKQISDFVESTSTRILDVGCGAGGLLDSLSGLGFISLAGMDPAPACAVEVTRRGHRGIVGTLDDHPLGEGSLFDGILLSHVLEHVREIDSALESVRRMLSNCGWIYVEVPDAARYGECLIAPHQDFNLEHINHFTAESLKNLLEFHGWKVDCRGKKTLCLGRNQVYPAVYAFGRMVPPLKGTLDRCDNENLLAYISLSDLKIKRIDQFLERNLVSGRPIFVWGVGQFTMRLLGETSLGHANILAFVDSNPIHHGKRLKQRPIITPTELHRHESSGVSILIGSLVNLESIEETIRESGFWNSIINLREI